MKDSELDDVNSDDEDEEDADENDIWTPQIEHGDRLSGSKLDQEEVTQLY